MRRLLAAALLCALPLAAQEPGAAYRLDTVAVRADGQAGGVNYSTMPAPSGCTSTELAYFLGSPATLTCLDATYTAATRSFDVTDGRVQAANLKAIGLGTPGSITVTPTLTQVGTITTVAGSALVDGDYFTIKYDGGTIPIEFDLSPGDGTTGGRIPLLFTAGDSADLIRDNVILTLNAAAPTKITASSGGAATVALVLDTPGADASATPNTENVADAGFAVTGFVNPTAATTVTYRLYACLADGSCTEAGAASSTAASTATLSASNFLRLTWTDVSGAASYKVGRYVSPTSPATTGIIWTGTALTVDDTGLAGDGSAVGTIDTTGLVSTDHLRVGTSATAGHVLTMDANGYATPQAASGGISGLTAGRVTLSTAATTVGDDAGLLYDSTNNRLSIVGGLPATDGTAPALSLTATLPASPSAAVNGVNVNVTSAGSAGQNQIALQSTLAAGSTSGATSGLDAVNTSLSAPTNTYLYSTSASRWPTAGARAIFDSAMGAAALGLYAGATGTGSGGHRFGIVGASYERHSNAIGIGVLGAANNTGAGSAGVMALLTGTSGALPTATATAALVANNTNQAAPIFLAQDNGTTVLTVADGGNVEHATANGAKRIVGQVSELLTLSTVGTTTDTSADLLPANSIIEAVVVRVTTTITTATDWAVGDPTTAARFAAANATMTAGATSVGTVQADQTGAAGPRQVAAAKVRITTTGTPGAGAVRITVFYRQYVAPTS